MSAEYADDSTIDLVVSLKTEKRRASLFHMIVRTDNQPTVESKGNRLQQLLC